MTTTNLKHCTSQLMTWYESHYRLLPWRESRDPYRIWISEIMLQQTRIEAAMPYYRRFLETCPTVESLAALSEDRLLKLWEGLGYYSRARNLQKAARIIMDKHDGQLPADYEQLLQLPGIGEYTAGAIASIAFDIPVPAVDGNVMRVLSRLTGDAMDVLSTGAKRHFGNIVHEMLPRHGAGQFNQALMELGETVCLPNATPHCTDCPWHDVCVARAEGTAAELPIRTKKKPRTIEQRIVLIVLTVEEVPRVVLHKRSSSGLLANLWELPNMLVNEECLLLTNCRHFLHYENELPPAKHIFSHVEWHMTGKTYRLTSDVLPANYTAVTLDQLQNDYALPSAFRTYAAILPSLLQKEDE